MARRSFRKSTSSKRRPMWRKLNRRRGRKPKNSMVLTRRFDFGTFSSNVVGDVSYGQTFSLSQLPNSAELTSLFDFYKLLKVKLIMTPINPHTTATAAYKILSAVDYNDTSAPNGNDIRQFSNCRVHNLYNDRGFCSRTLKPQVLDTVYNSSVSSGYAQSRPAPWLSTDYPSIPHYSIKFYGDGFSASTGIFKVDVIMTVALKNVK